MIGKTRRAQGGFHTVLRGSAPTLSGMPKSDRSGHFPERLVKQGLVSLAVAARMVHRRAYPQQYTIAEPALSEQQLDALAHVIATLAQIYTVNYRSAQFRELPQAELEGAVFREGAQELAFADGRAVRYLAARVEAATVIARKLREITTETPDAARTRKDKSPPTPTR
jgi:hypothetical protein